MLAEAQVLAGLPEARIYLGVMAAGFASFLSPCVLPLVPPYLGYIGGTTLEQLTGDEAIDRRVWLRIVIAAMFFVLGFSTVFLALGAGASTIGQLLLAYKAQLSVVAGVIIILFGLHFVGLLRIPLLYQEFRFTHAQDEANFAGAYVMGLAFAFGWSPCIGPILGAVLAVATQEHSVRSGVSLLAAYSLGLGIPFILAAVAIRPFLGFSRRFKKHFGTLEKVMGALLILTGLMFVFGAQNAFSLWMQETFPALRGIESWVTPEGLGTEILNRGAQAPN